MTEAEVLARHRAVWEARPELRQVYREWFARLTAGIAHPAERLERRIHLNPA